MNPNTCASTSQPADVRCQPRRVRARPRPPTSSFPHPHFQSAKIIRQGLLLRLFEFRCSGLPYRLHRQGPWHHRYRSIEDKEGIIFVFPGTQHPPRNSCSRIAEGNHDHGRGYFQCWKPSDRAQYRNSNSCGNTSTKSYTTSS
jgi:hypothetical protein